MAKPECLKDFDLLFKVIIVGNASVGKTSILLRYVEGVIPESTRSTVGVDFKIKTLEIAEMSKIVKMQIWDTAGQERFQSVIRSAWRGARGVIFAFSLDDRASYDAVVMDWYPSSEDLLTEPCEQMMLVGNKCDLPNRKVTTQEAQAFAREHNMLYFESSALTDANITDMFYQFCHKMSQKFLLRQLQKETKDAQENSNVIKNLEPPDLELYQNSSKKCGC